MKESKPILLIPVELQVREFDPKLLLACVAAKRGFPALIGPRREMHFFISSFTGGIYLSKSTTKASHKAFRNLKKMGNRIVVWDEEALVSAPARFYYRHRISSEAVSLVSHLFAWGEENAELWRNYPDMPDGIPIHITGNPRGDMLRPELKGYFESQVAALRRTYGDFILINTNFNLVNAFHQDMNLLIPSPNPDEGMILSRRSRSLGLSSEYAEDFTNYKRGILNDFREMIPALEKAFPQHTIVVRPQPVENQGPYHEVAAACKRVRVINEGNVVPWILASRVLIHNGCTTGIEAHALGVPAIAYRSRRHEEFDRDFHRVPNQLSHECFDFQALTETLEKVLAGELGVADDEARKSILNHHLAAQDGPLACERILDVLEELAAEMIDMPKPALRDRLGAWLWTVKRRIKKPLRGYRQNMSHNKEDFLRYRYPEISLADMRGRVSKFQELLHYDKEIKVEPLAGQFFRLS